MSSYICSTNVNNNAAPSGTSGPAPSASAMFGGGGDAYLVGEGGERILIPLKHEDGNMDDIVDHDIDEMDEEMSEQKPDKAILELADTVENMSKSDIEKMTIIDRNSSLTIIDRNNSVNISRFNIGDINRTSQQEDTDDIMDLLAPDMTDSMDSKYSIDSKDNIDITETNIKQELPDRMDFTDKSDIPDTTQVQDNSIVMNANVLAVKEEIVDDWLPQSQTFKENQAPPLFKKTNKNTLSVDPNSFARNLTVRELVRLHFSSDVPKFVQTSLPFVDVLNVSTNASAIKKLISKTSQKTSKDKEISKKSSKKLKRKSSRAKKNGKTKVKKEPVEENADEWEQEIIKANREWTKNNYRVIENPVPVDTENPPKSRSPSVEEVFIGPGPKREKNPGIQNEIRFKPLPPTSRRSSAEEAEIDDPTFGSKSPTEDDITAVDYTPSGEDDASDEDYVPEGGSYRSDSLSPDIGDMNENMISRDDNSNDEEIEIKEELTEDDIQEKSITEVGDYKVETFGDYSKCPRCEKFIRSTFIIRHIKSHDVKHNINIKCPYKDCDVTFSRANNLRRHLKSLHSDSEPYVCVYKNCNGKKYESAKELRDHIRSIHKKENDELKDLEAKHKCEFPGCDREYGKLQHLREHFRKHTGEKRYKCEVCGMKFFVHGHMKRHLYSHTGIKPHACRWKCGAIFASYGGRMKHERAQHSENPYKLECDICGRPFRFDRELDKHKMTHLAPSERQAYRCSFCGIIFDTIPHRERHEQRHKDKDDFHCEECNKYFKNEKNLRHHIKAHHENKDSDDKKSNAKKEKKEPPKYPCHLCNIDILFPLTALRRHLARKHSTNFKCEKEGCDKTFAQKYQYDAHMKLHAHRHCQICGKDFKRKQNADIHLMGVHGYTKEDLVAQGR